MFLKRIIGFLLIIGAVGGIIFGLIGLIELWRYRPVVTKTVVENLALVDQTLTTTQNALILVGKVVLTTTSDVTALQASSTALAQAIQDTSPTLDSLISLTGKDFPASIKATQTSLASAQGSALVVDNVLAALTSIPFSPVGTYAPAVPRHLRIATRLGVSRINAIIKKQAEKTHVILVDVYKQSLVFVRDYPEVVSADGFHPSDFGYAIWANTIISEIRHLSASS